MFIFTENEKYVGMDNASGGYPYITDHFMSVKVWRTEQEARDYYKLFDKEDWQLRELRGLSFSLPI